MRVTVASVCNSVQECLDKVPIQQEATLGKLGKAETGPNVRLHSWHVWGPRGDQVAAFV